MHTAVDAAGDAESDAEGVEGGAEAGRLDLSVGDAKAVSTLKRGRDEVVAIAAPGGEDGNSGVVRASKAPKGAFTQSGIMGFFKPAGRGS